MNYPETRKTLLEKIRTGDEVSWKEFFDRYSPVIAFVGKLYNFSDADCDDLVQNVMVKFFDSRQQFVYREKEVKFRTWFSRVIRSQAVDMLRKNRRVPIEFAADHDPFADEFDTQWRKVMLDEAMDELRMRLESQTYQAFELYGLQGRKLADVMSALNLSKDQVYAAKSRGKKLLREIIERRGFAEEGLHLEK